MWLERMILTRPKQLSLFLKSSFFKHTKPGASPRKGTTVDNLDPRPCSLIWVLARLEPCANAFYSSLLTPLLNARLLCLGFARFLP